jgi:hypothetical protein
MSEPVRVRPEVLAGIKAVRDLGVTNMFMTDVVAQWCEELGYDDAAYWIWENGGLMVRGVTCGFVEDWDASF